MSWSWSFQPWSDTSESREWGQVLQDYIPGLVHTLRGLPKSFSCGPKLTGSVEWPCVAYLPSGDVRQMRDISRHVQAAYDQIVLAYADRNHGTMSDNLMTLSTRPKVF
jgi:hypothetical protein